MIKAAHRRLRLYLRTGLRQARREIPFAAAQSDRRPLDVAVDMLWCLIRWGASPSNYEAFGWADRSVPRSAFMTFRLNQRLLRTLNGSIGVPALDDKGAFVARFASLLGRHAIILETATKADIEQLARRAHCIVLKERHGSQGSGVRLLPSTQEGVDEAWRFRQTCILEEPIRQHESMTKAFGHGVSAIRIVAARDATRVLHLYAVAYLASPETASGVVNIHVGALVTQVDISTGSLMGPALAKDGHRRLTSHPSTGVVFDGFRIPYWERALQLVERAMYLCPEARIIGWDIGIAEDQPVLIEGNSDPGTYQYAQHRAYGTGRGLRSQAEALLKAAPGSLVRPRR